MTGGDRSSGRWWRPHSLRTQLLLWLITLHLGAAVLTAWFSFVAYGNLVHNAMDDQMRLVADSYGGSDPLKIPRPMDGEAAFSRGVFIVQIWSPDGHTLRASSWPVLAVPLQSRAGFSDVSTGAHAQSSWRVFTAEPGPRADQPRVQVLQNEDYRRRRALRRALLEGLPITLLLPLALLILWIIVSAASRSLRAVARDVASQDERSPTELSLARVPEEIAPLVGAFNNLLSRVRSAFATQRRFVQDAAHELRTPMAAIGLQIENLRAHVPAGEATERFNQLEAGVTRAQHLIEQLLNLSRQDAPQRSTAGECVDIEVLLRESVSQLMVVADARGHRLRRQHRRGGVRAGGRAAQRVRQPDRQRAALCARRRRGRREAASVRRPCGGRRARHRPRHSAGHDGPRVRPLLPRARRGGRRQRPGAGHCAHGGGAARSAHRTA